VVAWFLLLVVAILVGNISAWFHGGIHRGISWQLLSKPLIIYDLCCMTVVELLPMIILSFLMSNLIESSISIRIARGTNTTPWRVGLAVLIGNLASWPVLLLLQ
jgi:hypothetical protein